AKLTDATTPGKRSTTIINKKSNPIAINPAKTVSFNACSPNCAPTDVEKISFISTGNEPELIISAKRCASSTVKLPDLSTSDVFNVRLTRGAEMNFASSSDCVLPPSKESPPSKSSQITRKF